MIGDNGKCVREIATETIAVADATINLIGD